MTSSLLTADLGNSSLKLCSWDAASVLPVRTAHPIASCELAGDDLAAEAAAWLARTTDVRGIALCAVGRPALEQAVSAVLGPPGLLATPDPGLGLACEHPETIGADRLFAARGAWELLGRSALVVDAGTALTVDALLVEEGRPVFAGGAIAPGPALLARALAAGGARLPDVEAELVPGVPALGRHTRAALASGVVTGFRGAARELLRAIGREAGLEGAPCVLTGGARDFLTHGSDGPLPESTVEDPWLVHRGLLAALLGDGGRAG